MLVFGGERNQCKYNSHTNNTQEIRTAAQRRDDELNETDEEEQLRSRDSVRVDIVVIAEHGAAADRALLPPKVPTSNNKLCSCWALDWKCAYVCVCFL